MTKFTLPKGLVDRELSSNYSDSEGSFLADPRENSGDNIVEHIEITLNHPRVKVFTNKTSVKQKRLYFEVWYAIINCYKDILIDSNYEYEYGRDGTVHLHGIIHVKTNPKLSKAGLISDMAKLWLARLPVAYREFKPGLICYFDDDDTVIYKCPSIKIAYHFNQPKRVIEWETYIKKCQ